MKMMKHMGFEAMRIGGHDHRGKDVGPAKRFRFYDESEERWLHAVPGPAGCPSHVRKSKPMWFASFFFSKCASRSMSGQKFVLNVCSDHRFETFFEQCQDRSEVNRTAKSCCPIPVRGRFTQHQPR